MEIAASSHFVASIGECEEPTPRHTALQSFRAAVIPREAGDVDERRAPTLLNV